MTVPAVNAAPYNSVAKVQFQHLATAYRHLGLAADYADRMRHVTNTQGDWEHVGQFVRDAQRSAAMLVESARDIADMSATPAPMRFRDIDARSAVASAGRGVADAIRSDLTPLGRARKFGEAAERLGEARDALKREVDTVFPGIGQMYGSGPRAAAQLESFYLSSTRWVSPPRQG